MGTMQKMSWIKRVNIRMVVLFGLVSLVAGWVVATVVRMNITGGIERYGDVLLVDLKAMSNFEMDQVNAKADDIPRKWRDLDGKRVVLEGEMYSPYASAGRLSQFQLVYSIAKCCFNGPKKVQHFVDARVVPDASVNLSSDSVVVRVTGKLRVNLIREAGRIQSVYQLEVEKVESV
jgi:hypothetical protein